MSTTALALIDLLLATLNGQGPVSAMIRKAHQEGRTITREELDAAFDGDDAARDALTAAIQKAGG